MLFRQIKSRKRGGPSRQAKNHLGHEHLEARALLAVYIGDVASGNVEAFDASGTSMGSFPASLAAEDYLLVGNAQGGLEQEIVVGDASTGDARIYSSSGNLLDTIHIQLMPGNGFALGDVNNSGVDEFIVANDITGFITVYDNTGTIQTVFRGGFTADDGLAAGDVNGDGSDEILTANNGSGIVAIFNAAGTNLGSFPAGFVTGSGFDVGDTDGIGGEDVLVADPATGNIVSYAVTGAPQDMFFSPYRLGDGFSVGNADASGLDEIGVAAGATGMVTLFDGSGGVENTFAAGFSTGDLLALGGTTRTMVEGEDRFEPNNTIATATVLGSIPEITLRELSIHQDEGEVPDPDIDLFKITANQTGKLIVNVFFNPDGGNLDSAILDVHGNVVQAGVASSGGELIVLPVVGQEMYFLRVVGVGGDVNTYELEIENFAAPVPDALVLDPTDDTGMDSFDNVTRDELSRIFVEADLADFANMGIEVLTPDDVANQEAGVAVQVFVNGVAVGYADAIPGTNNTLFQYTFDTGELSTTFIPVDGGGGLNFVKAAVQIFDGQQDAAEEPDPADGRTQQSEPLLVVLDATAPNATPPEMLASSDTGLSSTDNITSIHRPAFTGITESNAKVRIYARNVDTGVNGWVGQAVANYDGSWEITVEPLADATYDMTVRVEDLAGNLSEPSEPLRIELDNSLPQRPTIDLLDAHDTGRSDLDNVTVGDPTQGNGIADFRISAEAGSTVVVKDGQQIIDAFLFDNAFDLTDGVADNFGVLTVDFHANQTIFAIPAEGPHPLSSETTDASGNFTQSEQLLVTTDFTRPTTPTAPNLLESSDSGMLIDDNVTNKMSPAFDGQGEANANVRLYATNVDTGFVQLVGEGIVNSDESDGVPDNGSGTWEVTVEPLADGTYDITAEYEDLAGNVSQRGEALRIRIDTAVPNTPFLDLVSVSDSGRTDVDNVTQDSTPDVTVSANDTVDGIGNPFPHDVVYRIYVRPDGDLATGEILIVDSFAALGDFTTDELFTHTLTLVLNNSTGTPLPEGVHDLKLEVEDRAGNIGPDFLLTLTVDRTAPEASFGDPGVLGDGLAPDSDTGIIGQPELFVDRITSDSVPTFWGHAEADAIVTAYVVADDLGMPRDPTEDNLFQIGKSVAIPLDGNDAYPNGAWEITSTHDLNDPALNLGKDGERSIVIIAEDLAGNITQRMSLEILLDTAPPAVFEVVYPSGRDVLGPKPTDGPTELTDQVIIGFEDLALAYPAINPALALDPGNYSVVGDANGFQLIDFVEFVVPDGLGGFIAGGPTDGTTRVRIHFADYLPDDRLTLTVSDRIMDNVGNALDGDIRADEPGDAANLLPSGDGVPGGSFEVRFTVDSRPEIGTWSSGSFYLDTNGNFIFDPENLDDTNEDVVGNFGFTSDNPVAGSFVRDPLGFTNGFDRLAVYGDLGTTFDTPQFRWLIDFDDDGVPDERIFDPANIDGLPIAGDFDGDTLNGDEVGVFDGTSWWLDTVNHDFQVDQAFETNLRGYPIVGDFDGNGLEDLATWNEAADLFQIDLDGGVLRGWDGIADHVFTVVFAGVRGLPVAADFDQDGIDDLGLWVPDRSGVTDVAAGEWYIMVSSDVPIYERGFVAAFAPEPFGNDLFAQFGNNFALPIVGNFDPPVGSTTVESVAVAYTNLDSPGDVDGNGTVSPTDVLRVIRALEANVGLEAASEASPSKVYLDVNADGYLSPTDIVAVIQQLEDSRTLAAPVAEVIPTTTSSSEETSTISRAPRELYDAGQDSENQELAVDTAIGDWHAAISSRIYGPARNNSTADQVYPQTTLDALAAEMAEKQDGWDVL